MKPLVLSRKEGITGWISLNRRADQHRLNFEMCEKLTRVLLQWIDDEEVEQVFVDHFEGSRGFCAGLDFKSLAASGAMLGFRAESYLVSFYRLCGLIARYPKPIISFLDGAVKSGGVGLAVNGYVRVATERTVLSFPDTGYGYVPDAGATRFLSNLPHELGAWLSLTGARINGSDVAACGLATHFCPAVELPQLKIALQHDGLAALEPYAARPQSTLTEQFDEMEQLFSCNCAKELKYRLDSGSDWAKTQSTKVNAKSPLSTKIALRQMRTGRYFDSVNEALKIEYRITSRLAKTRNFREGVRAILVDMDYCPEWKPSSIVAVTFDHVAKFFSAHGMQELSLDIPPMSSNFEPIRLQA